MRTPNDGCGRRGRRTAVCGRGCLQHSSAAQREGDCSLRGLALWLFGVKRRQTVYECGMEGPTPDVVFLSRKESTPREGLRSPPPPGPARSASSRLAGRSVQSSAGESRCPALAPAGTTSAAVAPGCPCFIRARPSRGVIIIAHTRIPSLYRLEVVPLTRLPHRGRPPLPWRTPPALRRSWPVSVRRYSPMRCPRPTRPSLGPAPKPSRTRWDVVR